MIENQESSTWNPPGDKWTESGNRPVCKHCGEQLGEHVADSEPPWMCHPRHQADPVYGFFHGGDPRNFHPSGEDSTPTERENHRKACGFAEQSGEGLPCPSGWTEYPDGTVVHVLRAPFGIGVTTFPPTTYEPDFGRSALADEGSD